MRELYKYEKYSDIVQGTRWADSQEIESSSTYIDLSQETYPKAGMPVISDGKTAYVDGEDSHSIVFGATGSKKTRLFALPLTNICIKAGESFVAMDPKGEIYAATSGLAAKNGYKTIVLNFRDFDLGDKWNPLGIPYRLWESGQESAAITMINDLLNCLAGAVKTKNDSYWENMAKTFLLGCTMLLLKNSTYEECNFKNLTMLSGANAIPTLKAAIASYDEGCLEWRNLNPTLKAPDSTRGSILAVAYGFLSAFNSNEKLVENLSASTFDITDFAHEKTAVYLIIPDEKTTYHFLASVFVKQVYEMMIGEAQKLADKKIPVRLNFILDEFCNMPTIADMPSMITAARSRNMRFFLFVQGQKQLVSKYGEDANTIKGNCDDWFFLNSREMELLEEISDLCGTRKVRGEQVPLVSVSQLQRLRKEKGECLILYRRNYPFISQLADISEYLYFGEAEQFPMRPIDPLATCPAIDMEAFARFVGSDNGKMWRALSPRERVGKSPHDYYVDPRKEREEMFRKMMEEHKHRKPQ